MGFLAEIFSGGAEGVFKGVKDVVSAFKADPLELMKLETEMAKAEMNLALGLAQAQTKINEVEAASQDKFVSRWRPAIGWICGAAYAYSFIIQPFAVFLLTALGHHLEASQLPHIPLGELSVVLMGMLGLGTMRSVEKIYRK